MAERYPLRMRRRIVELYERGESTRTIADLFGLSVAGVRRVRQHHRERGDFVPRQAGGRPGCCEADAAVLRQLMAEQPDLYVRQVRDELQARTGTRVCRQTVGVWLRLLGLTRKKSPNTRPSS